MKATWLRLAKAWRLLTSRLPTDPLVARIRDGFPRELPASGPGPLVAIQCVEDPLYLGLFGALLAALRSLGGVRGRLVVVRSINGAVGVHWRARLLRSRWLGTRLSMQWVRAFRPLVESVAYRSLARGDVQAEREDAKRSHAAWQRWCIPGAAFELEVDGVEVGDLVVDSYLRFRPSPRFDPHDPFTRTLMEQAHRDVRHARAFFGRERPALYLTSYTTYLEHGIAARVALQEGVRVHSFGSLAQFGKQLRRDDPFHTPDASSYRSRFEALDGVDARLGEAAEQLGIRLSGGIDRAMTYMRASAYGASGVTVPADLPGAVVVFLHDFYDSPHIYHDLVFPDFWTWICCTIETLQTADIPFFLKPHPNQVALSGEALTMLRATYPDLRFLPAGLSNTQLVEGGMQCGVTVYGSVAHELAYLGVPTIACARHPHAAFDFCRTARTAEDYRQYLRTPGEMPTSKGEMRRQALAFYYMQNLYGTVEELDLRARFNAMWKSFQTKNADGQAEHHLQSLRTSPGFDAFVGRLIDEVDLPLRAGDGAAVPHARSERVARDAGSFPPVSVI